MKVKMLSILLCMALCLCLFSACSSDSGSQTQDEGQSASPQADVQTPDGSSSSASDENGSEGSSNAEHIDTEYYNIVGRITAISDRTITYNVYSDTENLGIRDYSSLNINTFTMTNQSNSVEVPEDVPVYIYSDGEQVECDFTDLASGQTIIMAYDWTEATLQFVVLANLTVGSLE